MKCPVCDEAMREVEKHGVAIDICPGCKGIWLDRGELEKLMDLASTYGPIGEIRNGAGTPDRVFGERRWSENHDHDRRDYSEHGHGDTYPHKKRRGSWLSDIIGSFGGGED